jgi:hypothetical protein
VLMQPDALDELRPRIDECDVDVGSHPQVVGGRSACVSASDDDDIGVVVFSHALKTPPIADT